MLDTRRSRASATGRLPVATNGCFVEAGPDRRRSEHGAVLESSGRRLWVVLDLSAVEQAAIRVAVPSSGPLIINVVDECPVPPQAVDRLAP